MNFSDFRAGIHETPLGEYAEVIERGDGAYAAYFPHHDDRGLEEAERAVLRKGADYEDSPDTYKIHVNPPESQVFLAAAHLIDLCRERKGFREALFELKFWIGENTPEMNDMPRIVLYPNQGLVVNAFTVASGALACLKGRNVRGDAARIPRFSVSVDDSSLVYLAQGSGWHKKNGSGIAYWSAYAEATNYAVRDPRIAAMFQRRLTEQVS